MGYKAKDLTVYINNINIIDKISFDFPSGSYVSIIGPNGAGKSTLVNIISGVFQPDQGEYTVNEKRVLFKDPRQALDLGISTVYQNLAIIPIMNIYRNFFLGNEPTHGHLNTINKDFAIETTIKELKKFDINIEDAKRPAGTLSGGQRQILAIARALYFGAKILILDEPTSALGVRESAKVVEQIAQLREHNINVILVSHNIEQAFSLGDEFFIFKNGELVGQFNKMETSANKLRSILEK